MKFEFNKSYFFWFLILLATETAIAVFLKTGFIRHTFGDFLVVILLYCFLKSFWNTKPLPIGILVLLFAYGVELLQLTSFLEFFNLGKSKAAHLIFGNTFEISDLVAYTFGIMTTLSIEYGFEVYTSNKKVII